MIGRTFRRDDRRPPMKRFLASLVLAAAALPSAWAAPDVTRLEVRIATGADGAAAGGYVELRIRETGRPERRLPIASADAWPAGSLRVFPVPLREPLDVATVERVGLYYRSGNASTPDSWEVASAEVLALRAGQRVPLLGAPIRGVVLQEGELAGTERAAALTCVMDEDCSDARACNGAERCDPGARGADARGCVRGAPLQCPVNQACIEGQGCRGVGEASGSGGVAIGGNGAAGSGAEATSAAAAPATVAPSLTPRSVPVQTCSGRDVLLTDAAGSSRLASCPNGTGCVAQPNGTGICVPGG
jgi:hypothetical protein